MSTRRAGVVHARAAPGRGEPGHNVGGIPLREDTTSDQTESIPLRKGTAPDGAPLTTGGTLYGEWIH